MSDVSKSKTRKENVSISLPNVMLVSWEASSKTITSAAYVPRTISRSHARHGLDLRILQQRRSTSLAASRQQSSRPMPRADKLTRHAAITEPRDNRNLTNDHLRQRQVIVTEIVGYNTPQRQARMCCVALRYDILQRYNGICKRSCRRCARASRVSRGTFPRLINSESPRMHACSAIAAARRRATSHVA